MCWCRARASQSFITRPICSTIENIYIGAVLWAGGKFSELESWKTGGLKETSASNTVNYAEGCLHFFVITAWVNLFSKDACFGDVLEQKYIPNFVVEAAEVLRTLTAEQSKRDSIQIPAPLHFLKLNVLELKSFERACLPARISILEVVEGNCE